MADKPKPKHPKSGPAPGPYKKAEPPPIFHEWWSAISPGDLGLKAGYWTGNDSDPMTFLPIVGWVTVLMRKLPFIDDKNLPQNGFYPVVISDLMFPELANLLPNYCAIFLKDMTDDQAKAWIRERKKQRAADSGAALQPTMPMGQA